MAANTGGQDPESEYGQDQVKVFSHEGDGENTEHLNSMDLHDVKTDLEKEAETPKAAATTTSAAAGFSVGMTTSVSTNATVQQASIRSILPPQMVYTNGSAVPFMMPPFAAGTPIYTGLRPVKMEGADWTKVSQGQINIPAAAYGYPTGFVSGLSIEQAGGLRPTYPFMIPGQYVTQMPYQQLTALGNPIAPNAAVHPNSGIITPQVKEKKPHIKKPLNAFMLFMKEKRADVIKECTLKESAAINQILGKMWHALDRSEQAKYYEMAREERARHLQMYPGWSARDNYAVHKKRKKRKNKPMKEEEEEEQQGCDPNARKCRARYGLEQQDKWCGPCRRKKKCVRYSEGDDEDHAGNPEDAEDNVLGNVNKNSNSHTKDSSSAETRMENSTAATMATVTEPQSSSHGNRDLPTIAPPNQVPVTLQTIAT